MTEVNRNSPFELALWTELFPGIEKWAERPCPKRWVAFLEKQAAKYCFQSLRPEKYPNAVRDWKAAQWFYATNLDHWTKGAISRKLREMGKSKAAEHLERSAAKRAEEQKARNTELRLIEAEIARMMEEIGSRPRPDNPASHP